MTQTHQQEIEDGQLSMVRQDWVTIHYIQNHSEAVQLAAVRRDGYVIRYIQNPSEAVQLAAVRQHGYAIQYIKIPVKRCNSQQYKKMDMLFDTSRILVKP